MTIAESRYPSSDGIHQIFATRFLPDGKVRAVIQIVHGMVEHTGRYEDFAQELTAQGFLVAGNDHLGHGRTVNGPEEFGYFAKKDGVDHLVDDVKRLTDALRKDYPGVPLILFGHSMGSFIARLYLVKYPEAVDAAVINGTAGRNPALPFGKFLCAVLSLFRGGKGRSAFIAKAAWAGYNKHYDPSEGPTAWLTRDASVREAHAADPLAHFIFTISGYRDLFRMLGKISAASWYNAYPKDLPTYIVSGDDDPVGSYGKGPREVEKRLVRAGATRVAFKLYEGARHELHHETNRDEYYRDLLAWLSSVLPA